jgi:hypothetical protein
MSEPVQTSRLAVAMPSDTLLVPESFTPVGFYIEGEEKKPIYAPPRGQGNTIFQKLLDERRTIRSFEEEAKLADVQYSCI